MSIDSYNNRDCYQTDGEMCDESQDCTRKSLPPDSQISFLKIYFSMQHVANLKNKNK